MRNPEVAASNIFMHKTNTPSFQTEAWSAFRSIQEIITFSRLMEEYGKLSSFMLITYTQVNKYNALNRHINTLRARTKPYLHSYIIAFWTTAVAHVQEQG